MRYSLTILLLFFFNFLSAQPNPKQEAWLEDLQFLQTEIHQNYAFLFKKISAEAFDKEVTALEKNIPNLADHEIIVELAKLVASFKYGHTGIGLSGWSRGNVVGFHQFPYNLYHFKDGVYIQGVHQDYAKAIGAKVLRIGQQSITEAMKAVYPVVSAENDQFFKGYGLSYLTVPEIIHAQGINNDLYKVELLLEKDGVEFTMAFTASAFEHFPGAYGLVKQGGEWLSARKQDPYPLWLQKMDKIYFFEHLPERQAVYIRHSQIQNDPTESMTDFYARVFDFIEKNDVGKLIVDVRLNGGGDNTMNKDIIPQIIANQRINQKGKFFVIIGRRTFSACQNLVNELDTYTNVTFVGEPTAENINFFGDVNAIRLPNSQIPVRLSFAWWQNKPPWDEREWMPPHHSVEMTFNDFVENRDPILASIWDLKPEDVIDPMEHIMTLFQQGKLEELATQAKKYIQDPTYQYVPFLANFLRGGKALMGNEQYPQAQYVFQLTTDAFPESAEAWLGLAQAKQAMGNSEGAKMALQKCIQLDHKGALSKKAQFLLSKL
ncbi:MAG: hypothetical protein Sapg2KO_06780 [Saprospiraceae bacterium]